MRSLVSLCVASLTLAIAAPAIAQAPPPGYGPPPPGYVPPPPNPDAGKKQPNEYVNRPITLPERTIAPMLQVPITTVSSSLGPFGSVSFTVAHIEAGAEYGINDWLTIGGYPLSVQVGDDTDWGVFRVYGLARFLNAGPAQLAARFQFLVDGNATVGLEAGMPVRLSFADLVRIDTGAFFTVAIDAANSGGAIGRDVIIGLTNQHHPFFYQTPGPGIPVDVSFQIIEPLFAGLQTGFGVGSFEDAGDTIFSPLGFFVGGSIPGDKGPWADITGGFRFPLFFNSGPGDAVQPDLWQVLIAAKGYFYL